MYLTKVVLDNVRCFEHLELDLRPDGRMTQSWGLILGDNGVGKTTVLRSIAMALCDRTSASGLLGELYGDWVRGRPGDGGSATMQVYLAPDRESEDTHSLTTTVHRGRNGELEIKEKKTVSFGTGQLPWNDIFICGHSLKTHSQH